MVALLEGFRDALAGQHDAHGQASSNGFSQRYYIRLNS